MSHQAKIAASMKSINNENENERKHEDMINKSMAAG